LIQSQQPFDPNYVSTKTKIKTPKILLDK